MLAGKKVWIAPSFVSGEKCAESGANIYRGKFGNEEASMLLTDEDGIARVKKCCEDFLINTMLKHV